MYSFGDKSEERLNDKLDPAMVRVIRKAMSYQIMDFSVRETLRTAERQKILFDDGKTTTMNSKHLMQSDGYSHAVDLYPSPIDMEAVNKGSAKEISRFGVLAGLMKRAAQEEGVTIKWGGDWDSDGQTLDHTFFDAPHFERV